MSLRYLRSVGLGVFLAVVLLVLPFFLINADKTYVNIVGFHTYTRQTVLINFQLIIYYIRDQYFVLYRWPWIFATTALSVFWPTLKASRQLKLLIFMLFLFVISTAIAQSTATNITYDTPLLSLLSICGGYGLATLVAFFRKFKQAMFTIIWLVIIWSFFGVPLKLYEGEGDNEESMENIHRVATYINGHSLPEDLILTSELYLAVEAKRHVLPGFGIGRFFYFPEFTRPEAIRRGVLNSTMLQEAIQARQARFIVINTAHHWQNGPRTAEAADDLNKQIVFAGYRVVDSLRIPLPSVEQTRVYERN